MCDIFLVDEGRIPSRRSGGSAQVSAGRECVRRINATEKELTDKKKKQHEHEQDAKEIRLKESKEKNERSNCTPTTSISPPRQKARRTPMPPPNGGDASAELLPSRKSPPIA